MKPTKRTNPPIRFVNVDMLMKFMRENEKKLTSLPNDIFSFKFERFDEGDEWNSEHGSDYIIKFNNESQYIFGTSIINEDAEDWAQAESYEVSHCREYVNTRSISPLFILEKLESLID